jgi:hypothetical protein
MRDLSSAVACMYFFGESSWINKVSMMLDGAIDDFSSVVKAIRLHKSMTLSLILMFLY